MTRAPYHGAALAGAQRRTTMTPQERQLIDELFDRLASLENTRAMPTPRR